MTKLDIIISICPLVKLLKLTDAEIGNFLSNFLHIILVPPTTLLRWQNQRKIEAGRNRWSSIQSRADFTVRPGYSGPCLKEIWVGSRGGYSTAF